MHPGGLGYRREEIVQQVINQEPSGKNYAHYVPIKNAADKIREWTKQGAQIVYLTSRKEPKEIAEIQNVLDQNNFPSGSLEHRKRDEEYKDVAERIMPDILIEDDCESIGGAKEMTITFVRPEIKKRIQSIIVQEFGDIDHLPDDLSALR